MCRGEAVRPQLQMIQKCECVEGGGGGKGRVEERKCGQMGPNVQSVNRMKSIGVFVAVLGFHDFPNV